MTIPQLQPFIGKEGITVIGEGDVKLRQATVSSEAGKVVIGSRTGDVKIEAGRREESLASSMSSSSRGLFNKTTEIKRYEHRISNAEGSQIDGKSVSIVASGGKIGIKGSAVVGEESLKMYGKEGVSIESDINTYYQGDSREKTKTGLMGTGGIGFSIGKKSEQEEADRTQQSAARSQVGSLTGNVEILTEGHYQQTGSIVTSGKGDVQIEARSANITAARSDYDSNYKRTTEQKGLMVALNMPAVQAVQAVASAVKSAKAMRSSKNDRINALGSVNAGFEAMRAAEQVGNLATALSQNPAQAVSQDVSVSITYAQQKSTETQQSQGNQVEKSQINAGGKVSINTTGGGKDSTLTIAGSDISGKGGTHLKAEGKVNIEAVDENHLERSQNKSSGFNAGVAISYGSSGFAFGVTAGGNVAKGYGNGESRAWVGSQVGSKDSLTSIESGEEMNVLGSQVRGKRIGVTAKVLNIESLQDTMKYEGKQQSASGQVTVGYGFSASGSYNQSKMKADYASVKTQAGLFAGDEGYDVNVENHTSLMGGIITSTAQAELENKNRFSTGTLNYSNIANHANYKGSAFGASGGISANFETPLGDKGQAQSNKQAVNEKGEKLYQDANGNQVTEAKTGGKANSSILAKGWDSLTGSVSMGLGSDKDSQSSQTQSGINTKNLIIRDEQAQLEKTGKTAEQIKEEVKTDITTETAESSSGKLENRFDKEKVLKEITMQVNTTKAFIDNAQEAKDSVIDYYQEPKRKALRQAITDYQNANVENKPQYEAKIDELIKEIYALEHIRTSLDLTTGLVVGTPKVMSAKNLIAVLDTETRRESLKNSLLAPPIEDINDGGKLYSNVGHNSGAFDGIKLGGVRMNYGVICGENNSRCETKANGELKLNERGHFIFKGDKEFSSMADFLANRDASKKLYGATGGFQATGGEMFGIKYRPGSFLDKLTETYAGQHDLVGGQLFFYDKLGNGKQGLTERQQFWIDRASEVAVLGVTPTTVPHALPIEVMNLLFGVK